MTILQKEQYKSLAILTMGLSLIGWRWHLPYLILVALLLLSVGLVSSFFLKTITDIWLKIGEALGAVSSRTMLAFIFFLVLTPLAILYRMSHKSPSTALDTYYITRNHTYVAGDMEKGF